PGETNKIATIPLIDDGLLEEPEVISLGFGNPPIGAMTGLVDQASVVIQDNEIPSLIDGSFQVRSAPDDDVFAVLLQNDDKIVIGGGFSGLGPDHDFVVRPGVARFNRDGSLDSTFAISDGVNTGIYALAQQLDGKLLVGGGF